MRRTACLTPLAILLLLPPSAPSEERDRLADVLALQEAMHLAIERAEPSIACILVSRSNKYHSLLPAEPREPGRLGGFNPLRLPFGTDTSNSEYQAISRLDLSNPNNVPESYGSGIVLDAKDGLILTLAHVVRNATKIYVRLPGGRGSWADIHAYDTRSDLAVLRLIERLPNLKALKLVEGGKLRKGDFILTLSNPFAAGIRDGSPSASWGIVSNLRRRLTGVLTDVPSELRNKQLPLYCFNTLIQTDTRMNLGCSGGAVLDLHGKVVGLISSKAGLAGGETPGGFVVPLDAGMQRIIATLLRGEEVEYGFLGVFLMRANEAAEGSVRIQDLVAGGPAAQSGIRGSIYKGGPLQKHRPEIGDYILSIAGTPVHNNDDLFLAVGMHLAGNNVNVEVSETPNGPRRICRVKLAKFSALAPVIASKQPRARGGLRVDWTSTDIIDNPVIGVEQGVVIREVVPGSPANSANLHPGMIIRGVGRRRVSNPTEFYDAMKNANGPTELTLLRRPERTEERVTIDIKSH